LKRLFLKRSQPVLAQFAAQVDFKKAQSEQYREMVEFLIGGMVKKICRPKMRLTWMESPG
jgi:hypothetical protein